MYQQAFYQISKQVLVREKDDTSIAGKRVVPVEGQVTATCRSRLTVSAVSPECCAHGKARFSEVDQDTRRMVLDHYQQTKNMLVSYMPKTLGFF